MIHALLPKTRTGLGLLAGYALTLGLSFGADRSLAEVKMPSEKAAERILSLRNKIQSDSNDLAGIRELGVLLHIRNEEKRNPAEVEEGIRLLKKVTKVSFMDFEAKAWLGSLITMQAEFETNPGKQTYFVKQGAREMDAAIKAMPEDVPIRLIRGYNSLTLPPFLNRNQYAVEDFQFILDYCKKSTCQDNRIEEATQGLEKARARS